MTGPPAAVLDLLGLRQCTIAVQKDVPPGNGSWLVEPPGGARLALRRGLMEVSPRLGTWAAAAAAEARTALMDIGAGELPVTVVHGDFAAWNVHYEHGRLAGVLDFGLTHLDSRPYELAIARTYRAPETIDSYRGYLARQGWPLTEIEEAAVAPLNRAFRIDMAAWRIDHGRSTGDYDLAMIERQLSRTGTPPP